MSDYMFMLENHLSAAQAHVVAQMQAVSATLGYTLFLTGGAMRDMLGGFPISDLDFTVEGNALKMAKPLADGGATMLGTDEHKKSVEFRFPGGVRASVGSAHTERYARPGAKPQILPATIHEDLRSRDFTVNAIALSLNRASKGLLLDPNNGLADLERKELRSISNYTLYDDPSRLIRLIRFRTRLHFTVAERTWQQYENAREAGLEQKITPASLLHELRNFTGEPDPAELLKALDEAGLMKLYSPALTGANLNLAGFQKLLKARRLVPFGVDFPSGGLGLFLHFLLEKLGRKERQAFLAELALAKAELDALKSLESKSSALETELKAPSLQKPSRLFAAMTKFTPEVVLYTVLRTNQRLVQDRIKNFLQKYLPLSQEIVAAEVAEASGAAPGTPKFEKKRQELIATRLDARPKKTPPPEPEPEPAPVKHRGRRGPRTATA